MVYHLKKIVLSWRFLVLILLQIALYFYSNYVNLSRIWPGTDFYSTFVNSTNVSFPLLALLCAVLVGLQTYDELEKCYQPMLFSRIPVAGWIRTRFVANALAGGIFILLPWVITLLVALFISFPPNIDLFNFQSNPYISIVSDNATIAVLQMIALDFIRVFLFGMLLGTVATLGAASFKSRFHSLTFPALFAIVFEHYASVINRILSWHMNITLFNLAGRYMKPWFSFLYFGLTTLLLLTLANCFVLSRVRHE